MVYLVIWKPKQTYKSMQSDSGTLRVSVCVLDRFRCWSNFCGEIDLQSDLELL
jgi:hypothetical protein